MKFLTLASMALVGLLFSADTEDINKADIQTAAKLAGLDFTDTETDLMFEDVKDGLSAIENNRKIKVPNSVAPTLTFSPILPGWEFDEPQQPVSYEWPKKVKYKRGKDELAYYTVAELASLIKSKKVTSVELTTYFLNRVKAHNDTLKCVITITEELAMSQAKKADELLAQGTYLGPLHGIPYGAKDLLSTKTYKTTWGAEPYKDQVIDEDATVIKKLEDAGAVLIAKTTLGALAWGDVWFGGTTKNPWNMEGGSSGSSAGSASGVSAGLFPFAIGTETLGSIVSPSTVCGTTGLRPTFGRVSKSGAMALSWSMDKIGPITRNAQDAAMVLNAIQGVDGKDLSVQDIPFNYNSDLDIKTLRVGYVKSAFDGDYPFKKQDEAALKTFQKLGIELIPIELPETPDIVNIILTAEAAAAFDELTVSGQDDLLVRQIRNAWPNTFRTARLIPAVEYIKANRIRQFLMEDMDALFDDIDVIIHPSWASSALGITNLTGQPCIVFQNGFQEDGTPTSISIMGDLYKEGEIIALAQAFQFATDFEDQHPEYFR